MEVEKVICPSRKTWFAIVALLVAMLALSTVPAGAQTQFPQGTFWVELGGDQDNWDNSLIGGGGNGWFRDPSVGLAGPWFEYPQTAILTPFVERMPRFWNQWYYDGVLDKTRYKIIDIWFDATPVDPTKPSYGMVYLNWSTDLYPVGANGPPLTDLGPNGEQWIGRDPVWQVLVPQEGVHVSKLRYRLPIPYNPAWVSIDVRGFNVSISNGVLIHECVPEPSSILALLCGLGGVCGLARRMKR